MYDKLIGGLMWCISKLYKIKTAEVEMILKLGPEIDPMMHNAKLFMLNYEHIRHVFLLLLVCQSQIIWSQRDGLRYFYAIFMTPSEIYDTK